MDAILNPAPAISPDPSSRSFARLVAGLAALVIGVAAFLGSAVQPNVESYPVVEPAGAAIQTAGGPTAAGHDTARTSQFLGRLISAVHRPSADRRATRSTILNSAGAELDTVLAEGTYVGSAHVGTSPLQPDGRDVRWGLIEMAAAQRRDWARRCPCPVYAVDGPHSGPR